MFQPGCVCHLPPLPPGSRPLRRPLLLSCVRRQGTRVGTGVPSGSGGADSRKAGGLNAQSPRGPSSLGNSFPLFPPLSPALFCIITKEPCRPPEHQVRCQSPLRLTSPRCLLIPNCVLIIPLLWHLSHYTEMPCCLGFVLNQTMAPRRAENVAPLPNRELNTA